MPRRLEFSHHALGRMAQRGITLDQVERTISEPDSRWPSVRGRHVVQRSFGGRRVLLVVVAVERDQTVSLTAYWKYP